MTPKEKAKELALTFARSTDVIKPNLGSKEMALLCVEEILRTNPTINGNSDDLITMIVQTKAYWYRVQQEIKKL